MSTGIILGLGAILIPVLLYFASLERKSRQQEQDRHNEKIKSVVDQYLGIPDAKRRTGVHDLIASGILHLENADGILDVCTRISKHGRPSPLHNLDAHLRSEELPEFFRWFSDRHDLMSSTRPFHNEKNFGEMIGEFRNVSGENQ